MKPILFNTTMVHAILDGRKTVTRRVVKPQPTTVHGGKKGCFPLAFYFDCSHWVKPPYQVGDVLWVRETWAKIEDFENNFGFDIDDGLKYLFKCDDNGKAHNSVDASVKRWRPSIHMPKEAARIFLKVTDVRVERLRDITEEQALKEGIVAWTKDGWRKKYAPADSEGDGPNCKWADCPREYKKAMEKLWNSTIKKKDITDFGWDANPWVFVVEFERITESEAKKVVWKEVLAYANKFKA